MDHVRPFVKSEKLNKYLLIIIYALTKFLRLYAVEDYGTTIMELRKNS